MNQESSQSLNSLPFWKKKRSTLTFRTILASERFSLGYSLCDFIASPAPGGGRLLHDSGKWALPKEATGELKWCQLSTT